LELNEPVEASMQAHAFQYLCGLTVLATHIAAMAMIATASRFIESADQVGSILIVGPLTLVYVGAFIRYVVNTSDLVGKEPIRRLNRMAAITMYAVILAFCVSLLFVVVRFVFYSDYRVNEFKMWLGAVESSFGALVGLVFERLFGVSRTGEEPKASNDSGPS
jgi:uncharacterized membrane protein YidH (DUF202 family)